VRDDDGVSDPDPLVARLRAAGCVFAEEEAALLLEAADDQDALERMVRDRVAGRPLEHLLGWAELDGRRVAVADGVFVPRQRTLLLVDLAAELAPRGGTVVDLCCGTGALLVAVLARRPDLDGHAADLDPAAVACARTNLAGPGPGRVHEGDLYDALPPALRGRVDVLVVNAPYVPTAEIARMPPEARDHEHRIALDGGPDGIEVHRRVAAGAATWLRPGGTLLIETGRRQADGTALACAEAGLAAGVVVREMSTLVRAISGGSGSSGTMAR